MRERRIAVLNMQDDRPTWALPGWAHDEIARTLGSAWELRRVSEPVSGREDGGGAGAAAVRAVQGAEILLTLGLPRELLKSALQPPSRLRWIHSGSAGVRSLLHPELLESDVVLTNSAGVHGPPMAESVLGMILHFARGFDHAVRSQAHGEWGAATFEQDRHAVREIAGATLGIIGLGGVGREVAWRARALGMHVLAVRNHPERPAGVEGVTLLHGEPGLKKLLAESDYLLLALPSTPRTRALIGAEQIAMMKHGGVLINVARGDIVDETALEQALRAGRLRGAALDVFNTEPLPAASGLWSVENILLTPHVSAATPRFWRREVDLIVDNVSRYLSGLPLRNQVDKEVGY